MTLIMLQSGMKLIIVANFELNRQYISENFCENKDKPVMHCEGRCFLNKELQKQNSKEKSLPDLLKEKSALVFYSSIEKFDFNKVFFLCRHIFRYKEIGMSIFSINIFHPPQ